MDIKDMIEKELMTLEKEFETYASNKGNNNITVEFQYASIPRKADTSDYGLNIRTSSLFYIKVMDWKNDEDRTFQVLTSVFDKHRDEIFEELLNCLYGGRVCILDEYVEPLTLESVTTLQEVSREYNIPPTTLRTRIELKNFDMIEGEDYKKLGERMPTLLSPSGVKKITRD